MPDIDVQPRRDLTDLEAIEKIRALAKSAGLCMFATGLGQYPPDVRPMALQTAESDGSLYFLSSTESEKNRDIAADPRVVLTFQNDSKYEYLSLSGHATIHTDRKLIDRHWTDLANAWFDGRDDPRLSVIRVRPTGGHYWETKSGKIVSMTKMVLSAVTGKGSDDGGRDGALLP